MRGFQDYIANDSLEFIRQIFAQVVTQSGFHFVELPLVEEASLYFRTSGLESDICNKELFEVRKYKGEFENWVLRPEGTASCMRALKDSGALEAKKEVRFAYFGPMFRYNRPQKGRYRQFYHAGIEYIGNSSIYADLEMIKLAYDFLKQLNITFRLEINSIGNCADRHAYRKILSEIFNTTQDTLKILDKAETFESIPHMQLNLNDAQRFDELCNLLDAVGIEYVHNPFLMRGLDYYNSTVFEFKFEGQTILAGGRYDGLMEQLDGAATSAIGFAAGAERVLNAMQFSPKNEKIAIVPLDSNAYGFRVSNMLQKTHKVQIFWDWSLKKALPYLSKHDYQYVVICGVNEEKRSEFILRNLHDGTQKICSLLEKLVI